MVVGEYPCGHVPADGVEERGEEREGVAVLARGEVGDPAVGGVAARRGRQRGGLRGRDVHALWEKVMIGWLNRIWHQKWCLNYNLLCLKIDDTLCSNFCSIKYGILLDYI